MFGLSVFWLNPYHIVHKWHLQQFLGTTVMFDKGVNVGDYGCLHGAGRFGMIDVSGISKFCGLF